MQKKDCKPPTQLDRIERYLIDFGHSIKRLEKETYKMATKLEEMTKLITDIGNDITEIDSDLQGVIDKINGTPGDGLTGAETDQVLALLTSMKERTRATADKVPNP